ncbi:hypothetical protein [Methylobacterium sp. P1-11]|nr:hypothetical protein [Methylobacterium sp. P1-11]
MSSYDDRKVRSPGPGRTVDTGDQLSSAVLLGISIVGAAAAVLLNALNV